MQLRSLTLHGFKSFGDRVVIEFDHGVTGVIGPNGSGKSNIIDGLKWVTGGGRASQYRAGEKTDLIFHGADGKRSVSYAEVELELVRGKERITVSRSLMRDGSGALKLNGKNCRLSDIEDALAGTGLARGALAIVGQGEVGQVLTADPEKLLNYVAEAADVARLSGRREQSQARLQDAATNLQRLEDIMLELEQFIEQLKEEAELAEKYTALSREVLHLRYTLSCHREESLEKEVTNLRLQDAQLGDKLSHSRLERRQTEESWQDSRRKASELEKRYREALTRAEAQKADYRIAQERLEAVKQQESASEREREALESETAFIASMQMPEQPADDSEALSMQLHQAEGYLKAIEKQVGELSGQRQKLEAELASLRKSKDQETQKAIAYETSKQRLEAQIEELQARLAQVGDTQTPQVLSMSQELSRLEQTLNLETTAFEELKEELALALQDGARLDAEANSLHKAAEQSRAAFEARRGYATGSKIALNSAIEGIHGSVADILRIDTDYRQAIAAALGRRAEYIITENARVAERVIDHVKSAGGWVTTLPLDLVKGRQPFLDKAIAQFPGVLGLATEFIELDDDYLELIYQLLGGTVLVETMSDAVKLARVHKQRPRLVSLDGGIMENYGAMSGGQSKTNVSVLGAAKDVEDTESEALLAKQRANAQQARVTELQERSKAKLALIHELKPQVNKAKLALTQVEQETRVQSSLKVELERQLKGAEQALSMLVKPESTQSGENLALLEANLGELLSQEQKLQAGQREQQNHLRDLKEALNLALERRQTFSSALKQYEANQLRLATLKQKLAAVQADKELIRTALNEAEQALHKAEENLPKDLKEHQESYATALAQAQELEQKLSDFTELQAELAQALESVKITLARREAALEIATEERKAFPMGLERLEQSQRICRDRLSVAEQELEAIGPVNHRAAQDLQQQKERYEDVQVQSVQATLAVSELEAVLERIDHEVTSKLRHAVNQLKIHFSHYVKELFGADAKANVLVHEENDRPKGLSIILQPPGKQTQSLNLLSVGERTMGAMAFLFSLLQGQDNKRLPIAILDEVDAPLDEANIRRFCTFVDHLAKQGTQFVLITHQKATFEIANVLWGITSEKGVSRVFSISRNEYEAA
ncbi:MAG: chromosome segregation protein SMC [Trueperaceae bacterium]|nr:chromosome segregation protein SMC [Trueperaceae bacterium]